jgi:hypothetical protein
MHPLKKGMSKPELPKKHLKNFQVLTYFSNDVEIFVPDSNIVQQLKHSTHLAY